MIAMPLNAMIPARARQRTLPDFQAFKELTAKIEMGIIAWSVGSQNQGVRNHLLAKVCTLLLCCRLLHTCRQAGRQTDKNNMCTTVVAVIEFLDRG
jgi:hypothetical protein